MTKQAFLGVLLAVVSTAAGQQHPAASLVRPAERPAPAANFVDVTQASGVRFQHSASHTSKKYLLETMGSGVGLLDFDGDGLLDIFLANGASFPNPAAPGTLPNKTSDAYWNRLYRQKKDGAFEDVTEKAGLTGTGYSLGVAVGDYDNDGYEDLYVTGYSGNHLYHNNRDGTFADVTDSSGTGGTGWSTSAAWVDIDGDGLLDLVVLRYVKWDFDDIWCGEHREGYRVYCHPDLFPPVSPLVYHNDGKGRFTEVSTKSGISVPGKGLGIAIGDYDRDRRVDIVVANDSFLEQLYRNKGDSSFEEMGLVADVAVDGDGHTYAGMGVAFADYDNDGMPDIAITDLANQKYALYKNNGDSTFTYTSNTTGIGSMSMLHSGWGISFLDYDNDGLKDLLVAQGHDVDNIALTSATVHYKEPMLLAHNTGNGFVDVSANAGPAFQQAWVGRGLAVGDIYNDGMIDAVVTTNDGPAYVIRNETSTRNHWLELNLVGHKSNRDAIGAEVKVVAGTLSQWETVSTAGSYLSSSDKRLHFGLGAHEAVNSIEVRWPSGILQILKDVHADQMLTVDEPTGVVAPTPKRM